MPDYVGKSKLVADLKRMDIAQLNPVTLPGGMVYSLTQGDWNRLIANVKRLRNGCWVWTATRTPPGYGRVSINRSSTYSHRVMYMALVGEVPAGFHVDHLCRNPPCCNPAHLESVTPAENMRRSPIQPSTINALKTECIRGHPLVGDNLITKAGGGRVCRACRLARQRALSAEKKAERVKAGLPVRGRGWTGSTCHKGHELTDDNIYTSRRGSRRCRKCHLEYAARKYAEAKVARGETTAPVRAVEMTEEIRAFVANLVAQGAPRNAGRRKLERWAELNQVYVPKGHAKSAEIVAALKYYYASQDAVATAGSAVGGLTEERP